MRDFSIFISRADRDLQAFLHAFAHNREDELVQLIFVNEFIRSEQSGDSGI